MDELQAIIQKRGRRRNPLARQYGYMMDRQLFEEGNFAAKIKGKDKKRYDELKEQLATFDHYKPEPPPTVFTATDVSPESPPTLIPGNRSTDRSSRASCPCSTPRPPRSRRPPTPINRPAAAPPSPAGSPVPTTR